MPELDVHGKVVVNFMLSMLIYTVLAFVLIFVLVGFVMLIGLGIVGVIFPIIGGIKANSGELWKYPLSIKILK